MPVASRLALRVLVPVLAAVTWVVDPVGALDPAAGTACSQEPAADGGTTVVCIHEESEVRALTSAEAAMRDDASFVCDGDGDGTSGRRVQVVFGYPQGTSSRLATLRSTITQHVAAAQGDFDVAAQRHGLARARLPRFVEAPGCAPDIVELPLPAAAIGDGATMRQHVRSLGADWNRLDRTYFFFVDANATCGWANVSPDTRPGQENENNTRRTAFIARVDVPCWGSATTHELGHTLGAVLGAAPNSTAYGHCNDGRDVMCYADGSPDAAYSTAACPDRTDRFTVDCNGDDYYAPSGTLGWWNTADSAWLFRAPLGSTGILAEPRSPSPSPSPTAPAPVAEPTPDPLPEPAPTPEPGEVGPTFADVDPDGPFAADVARLVASGVTRGCNPPDNDAFCPGATVTRAQLAGFLQRAMAWPDGTVRFADVPDGSPFAGAVGALAERGVTEGCPAGFCPSQALTRAQTAVFLARLLDLPGGTATFSDVDPASPFAPHVAALADAGLTHGCGTGVGAFCPEGSLTRAQLAALLVRAGLV